MQEIAPRVYIETSYAGVTLGAINWSHGLILIDAPFRPEDARSWRSALLNLGGGVDRMLVNLDGHFDRTLGSRLLDCTVIGHEKLVQIFRSRPVTLKAQMAETGSEWEIQPIVGSVRWLPPEITFTDRLQVHWDEQQSLILEAHFGPNPAAIWAVIPDEKVVFVGDALTPHQPPFLANANLPLWLESLQLLLSDKYREYIFVSGRGGLAAAAEVHWQIRYLEKTQQLLEELAASHAGAEETEKLVKPLLAGIEVTPENQMIYRQRLSFGLKQYYTRHYASTRSESGESSA